jgi:hypothetical protein
MVWMVSHPNKATYIGALQEAINAAQDAAAAAGI